MFGRKSSSKASVEDVQAGADTKKEDQSKKRRSTNSLKGLLGFGRKDSSGKVDSSHQDQPDKEFIKSLPPMAQVLFTNDFEKFKDLLKKKPGDVSITDKQYNRNLIHWAAIQGRGDVIREILGTSPKDADTIFNATDVEGRSPLHLAVLAKQTEAVTAILNVSQTSINTADKFGRQPLYYAVSGDDMALCTILLLRGANKNAKSAQGEPLLIEAIRENHGESALCLLNNNVEINIKDSLKRTPLHHAVLNQSFILVKELLDHGIGDQEQDVKGFTALQYAEDILKQEARAEKNGSAEEKSPAESIVQLLRKGPSPRNSKQDGRADVILRKPKERKKEKENSGGDVPLPTADVPDTPDVKKTSSGVRSQLPRVPSNASFDLFENVHSSGGASPKVASGTATLPTRKPEKRQSIHADRLSPVTLPRIMVSQTTESISKEARAQSSDDLFGRHSSGSEEKIVVNPLSRRPSVMNVEETERASQNNLDSISNRNSIVKMTSSAKSLPKGNNSRLSMKELIHADPAMMQKVLKTEEQNQKLRETINELLHALIISELVEVPEVDLDDNDPAPVVDCVKQLISEAGELKKDVEALDKDAEEIEQRKAQLEVINANLLQQLQLSNGNADEINKLRQQLSQRDSEIQKLKQEVDLFEKSGDSSAQGAKAIESLTQSLAQREFQLAATKQELDTMKRATTQGQNDQVNKIQELSREIEGLRMELEDVEKEAETYRALEPVVVNLRSQLAEAQAQKSNLASLSTTGADFEALKNAQTTIAQLQEQVGQLRHAMNQKELQMLDMEAELADEKEMAEKALAEQNLLVKQLSDMRKQLEDAHTQITHLEVELEEQPKEPAKPEELAAMVKQVMARDEEIGKLKRELFTVKTELEEKDARFEQELIKANSKFEQLRESVAKKERSYNVDANPADFAGNKLEQISEEPFSSKEQIYAELSSELNALQARLNNEIGARRQAQSDLQLAKDTITTLEATAADLKHQVDAGQVDVFDSKAKLETANTEVERLKIQINTLKLALEKERQAREDLQAQLNQLSASSAEVTAELANSKERSLKSDMLSQKSKYEMKIQLLQQQLDSEKKLHEAQAEELVVLKSNLAHGRGSQTDYINLMTQQLDSERQLRSFLEAESAKTLQIISETERELAEMRRLYEEECKNTESLRDQRKSLEQSLASTSEVMSSIQLKVEELQTNLITTRARTKELEAQLADRVREVEFLKQKEKSLAEGIAHYNQEISGLKAQQLQAEKSMFDAIGKDREEIKSLQQQLKEKSAVVESRDRQLSSAKDELDKVRRDYSSRRSDLEISLTNLEKEKARLVQEVTELTKQVEGSKERYSEMTEKYSIAIKTKQEAEQKFQDAQKQLNAAKNANTELSKSLESSHSVNKDFEQTKGELEKARISLDTMQARLNGAQFDAAESARQLNASKAKISELETEKEKLTVELRKQLTQLEANRKLTLESEKMFDEFSKRLDEFQKRVEGAAEKSEQRKTAVRDEKIGPESMVTKLEELWSDLDDLLDDVRGHCEEWNKLVADMHSETPTEKIARKTVSSLFHAFDHRVVRKMESLFSAASRRYTNMAADISSELARQLQSKETKIAELAESFRQKLTNAEVQRQSLELQVNDLKQSLSNNVNDTSVVKLKHDEEILGLQKSIEEHQKSLKQSKAEIRELSNKVRMLENTDSSNQILRKQVNILEQQLARETESYQHLKGQFDQLHADLADRDPDYAAEFDALVQLQNEILATKRTLRESSDSNKAADFKIQQTIDPIKEDASQDQTPSITPLLIRRKTLQRKQSQTSVPKAAQHDALTAQIDELTKQGARLETEYKAAQKFWEETRVALENGFKSERAELITQLGSQKETLDRLESICKISAGKALKEAKSGKQAYAFIHIILDKIERLQDEREELERIRISNERKLRAHYEYQLEDLLQDLDFSREQLQKMTLSFKQAEVDLVKLRAELFKYREQSQRERLTRQTIEQQVKEVKVLMSHGYQR